MEIEDVRDTQGNLMKFYNGFTYIKPKQRKQSKKWTKWNCVEKRESCKGCLLIFRSKKTPPKLVTEHNHPPSSRTSNRHTALDNAGIKTCRNPDNSVSLVAESVSQNSSEAASSIECRKHHVNLKILYSALLTDECNVDVLLTSQGQSIKCHKLILISSSAYFEKLLNETIRDYCFPAVAFTNLHFWQLKALIEYMYYGKVNINDKNLQEFLSLAKTLQMKGFQSWTKDNCLLSNTTHPNKQNVECNLVISEILNSDENTLPEQINHTQVQNQKRKHDLIKNDSAKIVVVCKKFSKFIASFTEHSADSMI